VGSGDPRYLKVVGDDLYFRACDAAAGCELWVSDGTPQRTRLAADLRPGARSSKPGGDGSQNPSRRLVASGHLLYFGADDGSGEELFALRLSLFDDGFESGTTAAWSAVSP
jgi:ELWxxDGT repeat protein